LYTTAYDVLLFIPSWLIHSRSAAQPTYQHAYWHAIYSARLPAYQHAYQHAYSATEDLLLIISRSPRGSMPEMGNEEIIRCSLSFVLFLAV
jgi:hypothetical protein